ncbi:MAG: hypothetical protein ACRDT4_00160 [Micromonosporaceae bacterium]
MSRIVINAPTAMQRIFVTVLAPVALVLLVCLGGILTGPLQHLLGTAGLVIFAIFVVLCLAGIGYGLLKAYRWLVWLEGSQLVVRGAITTLRCDLATAPVRIDSTGWFTRIPVLRARPAGGGRWLRAPLRTANMDLVDPVALRALAAVISSGARPEPDRAQAAWVVGALRQLADNPASRLL